jgi:release factor glutamine methyltransferase
MSKKIKEILFESKAFLKKSPIKDVKDSASLSCEIILCLILKCEIKDLFLNYENEISQKEIEIFLNLIKKRFYGKPLSYITNIKNFFGFDFSVNEKTLIPREDSEILVQKALEIFNFDKKFLNIADFGAGSGCIGLSFAKKYKNSKCTLVEKNLQASRKIRQNIKNLDLELRAKVFHGDWNEFSLKFIDSKFDLIFSNPPYINLKKKLSLMKSVLFFEPQYALFDENQENLSLKSTYQQIISKSELILKIGGYLIFEIDEKRQPIVFDSNKFRLIGVYKDFFDLPRCMILKRI